VTVVLREVQILLDGAWIPWQTCAAFAAASPVLPSFAITQARNRAGHSSGTKIHVHTVRRWLEVRSFAELNQNTKHNILKEQI
jgi:hypothetical protein